MFDEKDKIIFQSLQMTCESSPVQWDGETVSGEHVYIRYRWGILQVFIYGGIEVLNEHWINHPRYEKKIDYSQYHSDMSNRELYHILNILGFIKP